MARNPLVLLPRATSACNSVGTISVAASHGQVALAWCSATAPVRPRQEPTYAIDPDDMVLVAESPSSRPGHP